MTIEIIDFWGDTYEYEFPADIDLELWLLGYTNNGKYPIHDLKILEVF